MTTYYVAGPMTGVEDHNYPAFNEATATLRAAGHEVLNPAENDDGNQHAGDWTYYMRQDLRHLSHTDALVMLPGWRTSRGATLEAHIARQFGLPLYRLAGGELRPLVEVIGLSGYAQSGKDTAYSLLATDGWERASFADKLREALYALNPAIAGNVNGGGWRVAEVVRAYGWEKAKTSYAEVRELLQRLGTEVGRDILGPDVWVDLAMAELTDGGRYVFTDARFPNEAEAVVKAGGRVIRIDRPGCGPVNGHPSETALDDFPFSARVLNDGTLGDFAARLHEAIQ